MEVLLRLQQWYALQCDGNWEHQFGVSIESLDNPGWLVKIDITGTAVENRPFVEIAEGVDANNHPDESPWIHCSVRESSWQGAGDQTQLARLIEVFLDWADPSAEQPRSTHLSPPNK